MQGKYFLLVLMASYSQHIASSHILTSAYMDMSLPTCMRILTYTVLNDLCPMFGSYADYSSEEYNMPQISRELPFKKSEQRENLVKECCRKPCTLTELLASC